MFVFLLFSLRILFILDSSPSSDMSFSNIFSRPVVCSHSPDSVFHKAEFFNFNEVQLINYFIDHVFGVVSKKSLPYPWSFRFSPMLFSRSFIVLPFTFRSVIHFEIIFVKGVGSVSRFFACGCPLFPAPFVEKTIIPPLYYLCSFVKDHLTIFMGVYFWALYSVLLIYLSILLPKLHNLDYRTFTVRLRVSPLILLFFSIVLAIVDLLLLHINFKIIVC